MNFDKESKSEEMYFFFGGGGGRERGEGRGGFQSKKKTICNGIRLFFASMLYIKYQVPGSSGFLVLTQIKGVTER